MKPPTTQPTTTAPTDVTPTTPDDVITEMYVQVSMVQSNAALLLIFGSSDIGEYQINLLNDQGEDQNFTSSNDRRPAVVLLQPLVSG